MNYDQFKSILDALRIDYKLKDENKSSYQKAVYIEAISVKWVVGGESGGSCWDEGGEDHHYSVSGEPEPEFEDLDKFLLKIAPNISFLQYKAINKISKTFSDRVNEYYGNYTDYIIKYIKLKDLYELLTDIGIING